MGPAVRHSLPRRPGIERDMWLQSGGNGSERLEWMIASQRRGIVHVFLLANFKSALPSSS